MDYATIMVHLDASKQLHQRLHLAVQLALAYRAKLVGLLALGRPDPRTIRDLVDDDRYLASCNAWHRRVSEAAHRTFEGATGVAPIRTEWRAPEWGTAHTVQVDAHLADLVVLGQPEPSRELSLLDDHFVEAVILHCGRPVLIVPYAGWFPSIGTRVLVAWNGSREAARAIRDALPILSRADSVDIIQYLQPDVADDPWRSPAQHAVSWLAEHGVRANLEEVMLEAGDDPGQLLLSRAADKNSDLIVMGAYGHARVRELVLGGVTRTLLQSMTVPVLMSH